MSNTFPPGHFHSPTPDIANLDASKFIDTFDGVLNIDTGDILDFASDIFRYAPELSGAINAGTTDFAWCNSEFPPADAIAYYGMLRHLKPSKIVEVDSGFSTKVAISAIEANGIGSIQCIDPMPRDTWQENDKVSLRKEKVQDAPDAVLQSLSRGDVLFIDSSHQAKCQSDVLDIFFRIIDLLPPGVHIHFHDIFYPDDYPYFWLTERGHHFNEQYFLMAYLKNNASYRCRIPVAFIARKHTPKYLEWVGDVHEQDNECFVNPVHKFIKGGSFWIEKL